MPLSLPISLCVDRTGARSDDVLQYRAGTEGPHLRHRLLEMQLTMYRARSVVWKPSGWPATELASSTAAVSASARFSASVRRSSCAMLCRGATSSARKPGNTSSDGWAGAASGGAWHSWLCRSLCGSRWPRSRSGYATRACVGLCGCERRFAESGRLHAHGRLLGAAWRADATDLRLATPRGKRKADQAAAEASGHCSAPMTDGAHACRMRQAGAADISRRRRNASDDLCAGKHCCRGPCLWPVGHAHFLRH